MADTIISATPCPHCGSRMYSDFDVPNAVKVFVCSKPTCLHRIYPDYPTREGNQEMCYLCGEIFTVNDDCAGVLCPQCKDLMEKNRARTGRGRGRPHGKATPSRERRLTA
jgi:hypothetical protein